MAIEIDEERIRERAYHLWQQDGAPEGRADEYWEKARSQVLAESGTTSISTGESEKGGRENPAKGENGGTAKG
jgi:hypothetical protein